MVCVSVTIRTMFLIALCLQLFDCASITVQPVSINTTLNSTVVFSCEGTNDELVVRVNNEQATNRDLKRKGFSVTTSTINNGGAERAELTAIAYDYNNNTEVKCIAITDEPPDTVFSNIAILMIQGLLDSVADLDYTFIDDGSSVLLTWTAPYTLDNVPITGYYILVNGIVNITTTDNNTNIIVSATNPDPCILNNVSVSPINIVGIGSSKNISFRGRNSFNLNFDNYTKTGDITLHFNIEQFTGEPSGNIAVIIQCNETGIVLIENAKQLINKAGSIAGSVSIPFNQKCNISIVSSCKDGSKFIQTIDITIPPIKTSSSSPSVTPTLAPTASQRTSLSGIISGVVVGFVVLLVIVIAIICCLILKYKFSKKYDGICKKVKDYKEKITKRLKRK